MIKKIIKKRKEDMRKQRQTITLRKLREKVKNVRLHSTFLKAVCNGNPGIIAEVKFASPISGRLGSQGTFMQRIKAYEKAGFQAVSIITEPHFFKGKARFIVQAKQETSLPVLQKDFVIDAYQIYEAAILKSDALLFIARIVPCKTLQQFVMLAQTLGIEPVVEIVDTNDLKKACQTTTRVIAVNARDLNTFTVDIVKAAGLIRQIPVEYHKLGFSGIHSKNDISLYQSAGAQGILIGTALMKEVNVDAFFPLH